MTQNNYKIIFLGTPEFALPTLQALSQSDFKPLLVITQPSRPVGRKQLVIDPPVKRLADQLALTVKQPANQKELTELLFALKPDICILVAYGLIIKSEILALPSFGWLNIHPSLLPKYRGSAPIQSVILNGEASTGVTIIKLDSKVDHGPIIAQQQLAIDSSDTNITLHNKLAILGGQLLLKILPEYLAGNVMPRPQNDELATLTKIIQREDGQVKWQNSASQIDRQFRALQPWPGIFTTWAGKRLKIADLSVLGANFEPNLAPGMVFLTPDKKLAVKCGQDAIVLKILQLEGKNKMSAVDFIRGCNNFVGSILK